MNKILSYVLVAVAAGLLLFLGSFLGKSKVVIPQVNCSSENCQQLGAVSSPSIASPYLSVNDSMTYYNHTAIMKATTTSFGLGSNRVLCSIKSPVATSTIIFGSIQFTISSTTAMSMEMGKSSNPYATTTLLSGLFNHPANTKGTWVASTTVPVAESSALTFSPSNWFVVKAYGGRGTYTPTGTCIANFQVTE